MSLLQVDGLTVRYGEATVLRDVGFSVHAGEAVGLVGESGSGKSQTALAIMGLLSPAAVVQGSAKLDGIELIGASAATLNDLRARRMAMVFQDPMQALNPYLRVGSQLQRILIRHGIAKREQAEARVVDMLARVGLPDPERQARVYPHQLSGGMRQRAMIASALIAEPGLLIADEPTTALDVTVQAQILDLLEQIRADTALLLITHDLGVVAGRAERLLVLQQGRLVESGATAAVFAQPQHEHMKQLLASALRPDRGAVHAAVASADVLDIRHATVSYAETGSRRLQAVRDISLSVRAGETVAVVGESGSGKSSLVRAALGLVPMSTGCVTFCGEALEGPVQSRAVAQRRDLQLVFQDPVSSLNPQLRIGEIVAEPLLVHERRLTGDERRDCVRAMLARTGLDETFIDRYPHQLSGGQAQRVAIARALILEPKVLVCDEAVAALDGSVREQILALLHDAQQQSGLAIVFITHDLAVARAVAHRVLVMYLGRCVELADAATLFAQPRHPYTQALLEAVPIPDPTAPGGRATVTGEVASILEPPRGCAFHPRCPHAAAVCSSEQPLLRAVGGSSVACHFAEELQGL